MCTDMGNSEVFFGTSINKYCIILYCVCVLLMGNSVVNQVFVPRTAA